jgi:uncharacterized protein YbbK (DUF523 family)
MNKVLVSGCLLGEPVRYHGGHALVVHTILKRWQLEGRIVTICPEVMGGLPVPRPAAEIRGGSGAGVIEGVCDVRDCGGRDVTAFFLAGAERALGIAQAQHVTAAVLKDGSPSCGSQIIFDGTFSGRRRAGEGVTAALLRQNGIEVFSELEISKADAWLR